VPCFLYNSSMNTNPARNAAKPVLTPAQKLKKLLKSADFTTTLTREVDGTDTELEIAVFGEYEKADSSVGLGAGYCVHSAVRVSDGEEVELTPEEIDELAMGGDEKYRSDMEAAMSDCDCERDYWD